METPRISKSAKMILAVEFILLSYMLYVLATSLYRSYQIDRFIGSVEEENAKLAQENAELAEDFEYYRSDAYREKIAKQNFGLVRPGEEVIILAPEDKAYLSSEERVVSANREYYEQQSNPKKWFLFFFDRQPFLE